MIRSSSITIRSEVAKGSPLEGLEEAREARQEIQDISQGVHWDINRTALG
jgi:hypothetical protein